MVAMRERVYITAREFRRRLGVSKGTFDSDRGRGRLPDPAAHGITGLPRRDGQPQTIDLWTEAAVAKEVARREKNRAEGKRG
jgi:hypothetical protein